MHKNSTDTFPSENPDLCSALQDESYISFMGKLFEKAYNDSLISFTFAVPHIDPLALLEVLDDRSSYQYYWEKPEDEFALAAGESLHEIKGEGKQRFRQVKNKISVITDRALEYANLSHYHTGLHYLGGFSFFDENIGKKWSEFGTASFTIPKWQIIKEGRLTLLTLNIKLADFQDQESLHNYLEDRFNQFEKALELNTDQKKLYPKKSSSAVEISANSETYDRWLDSVTTAKEHIRKGKYQKIVLARHASVRIDDDLQPTHIANRLRKKYPSCYTFLIRQKSSHTFLGSSPERLMAFKKNHLLTEALAGSIERGSTATEDAVMEKELLLSSKNASEHNYVVQAIEQRLAPYVRRLDKGSTPVIKKLSNVQHLFTPITAWLEKNIDAMTVLEELHPTPAVGGYPWKESEPYIRELETFERGWYAGPVGWVNSKGVGEFIVAIRSGLIDKQGATFYAGCGIVEDSDAEAEWRETLLKLSPMLSALEYD